MFQFFVADENVAVFLLILIYNWNKNETLWEFLSRYVDFFFEDSKI